jgi:hypothetical protein
MEKNDGVQNGRIVAYIDLLGTSNNMEENTNDAIMTFSTYNTILSSKIWDGIVNPVDSYPKELQDLVKKSAINSFEYFIPFSDSIFIVSDNIDSFITQLSSFVYNCFNFTSNFYLHPEDKNNPIKGKMIKNSLNKNDEIVSDYIDCKYYPTIFRGGIAYGEVFPIDLYSISNKKSEKRINIAGKAVVQAVKLEGKVKGPRIIFHKEVFDRIGKLIQRKYVRKIKGTELYEILWPAIKYISENGIKDIDSFFDMFTSAVNLWQSYNQTQYSEHYFCFMELIVASTLQFYDEMGCREDALKVVTEAIKKMGLEDKISSLIIT